MFHLLLEKARAFLKENTVKFNDIIDKLVKITKGLNKRNKLESLKLFLRKKNPIK